MKKVEREKDALLKSGGIRGRIQGRIRREHPDIPSNTITDIVDNFEVRFSFLFCVNVYSCKTTHTHAHAQQ
jgi:hypothetical protein